MPTAPPPSPAVVAPLPSEPLLRAIGTFGLAAAIVNITVGGGIFRLPANVAGVARRRRRRSPISSAPWRWA